MIPGAAEKADRWIMNTYRRLPVTLVRGAGSHLYDEKGRDYLDFVAGIAVNALGHCHPAVVEAVAEQIGRLGHASNLFYTEQQAELAEALCRLLGWPDGRVFFANSGAEANECALKLARKWSKEAFGDHKHRTVAAFGSFHGRTFETLAATGQPDKWAPFAPLAHDFIHVPYDDSSAVRSVMERKEGAGAVLLEPIQGEGGVIVPNGNYLEDVSHICESSGATFILDEVQTGIGRTGSWFAFQQTGARPSVVSMAKALGNGLPIGACAARGPWAEVFSPGDHATTLGGAPVVCAGALAVLKTIERENLIAKVRSVGSYLRRKLDDLAAEHSQITAVRGSGLLFGMELSSPQAQDVALACLQDGLLVNGVTPSVLRLTPPYIIDEEQCDRAVDVLHGVFARRRIGHR